MAEKRATMGLGMWSLFQNALPTEEKNKAICMGPKIRYGQLFNGEEARKRFRPVDNPWRCRRAQFAMG